MKKELERQWDDVTASWTFKLVTKDDEGLISEIVDVKGDAPWANRQAKHYGIDMPKLPEEEK